MARTMAIKASTAITGCSGLGGRGSSSWVQATMSLRTQPRRLVLVARDRHVVDQDGAAGAPAAHHHVASYGHDSLEHFAQIAGDGDLLDREADLAALHPVAGRAARIIAGDQVHALAHELGDEQAFVHM